MWRDHAARIDAVVTDVMMPGMGGKQLAERLRASRPDLPIVFMTGWADRAMLPLEQLGARAVLLSKPFQPDELTARLADLLRGGA